MPSHRINLKGPWDYALQGTGSHDPDEVSHSGSVAMPREWRAIFGEKAGTAQFRRKFHRPTNLELHERVMLLLTEARGDGSVLINDQPVGKFAAIGEPFEFEISSLLKPFNELIIEINFNPQNEPDLSGGLYGAVALEIRWETLPPTGSTQS